MLCRCGLSEPSGGGRLQGILALSLCLFQLSNSYQPVATCWAKSANVRPIMMTTMWEGFGLGSAYTEAQRLRPRFDFFAPRPRGRRRFFKSLGKAAATTLHLARERVHVSSTRPEDEPVVEGEGLEAKAITCLSYDLGEGTGACHEGNLPPQGPPYNGTFYYLGGNADHFLTFVQQELGASMANLSDIVRTDIPDLSSQRDRFSSYWREGRLVVEDPNTLDMINNKTSFRELLLAYTTRMIKTDDDPITNPEIVAFLRKEYGADATADAFYNPERSAPEAMASLKALLEWFKQRFPYYKSACLHCHNNEDNRLLGIAYPSAAERGFNATLTEVYVCSKCHKAYRFPRSVVISRVMETRRGRCGEYSRLFFKAMEALNYRARWVVDWEDHVWVEVELPGRGWIHLDPCEAAVDEPLLYQSWGKNQTYILAFTRSEVEDVTHVYTSDFEAAQQRRRVTPQEFDSLLDTATGLLRTQGQQPHPRASRGKDGEGKQR